MEMSSSALRRAVSRAGIVWAGLFVFGIGFGVMVPAQGLDWWLAPLMSAVIFAGSAQFMMLGLMSEHAPIMAIALTTFLVNFRLIFYGLTYPIEKISSKIGQAYIVFAMIDEAFALISATPRELREEKEMLIIHVGFHIAWVSGCFAGALLGAEFLRGVQGLDFVLIALFVVLAMDAWRASRDTLTVVLAVASGGIGLLAGHGNMMIIGMLVLLLALIVRHKREYQHV